MMDFTWFPFTGFIPTGGNGDMFGLGAATTSLSMWIILAMVFILAAIWLWKK